MKTALTPTAFPRGLRIPVYAWVFAWAFGMQILVGWDQRPANVQSSDASVATEVIVTTPGPAAMEAKPGTIGGAISEKEGAEKEASEEKAPVFPVGSSAESAGTSGGPVAAPSSAPSAPGGPATAGQNTKPEAAKGPSPLTRPAQPEEPPEWRVEETAEGRIRLNFRGQSWPKILEWLADLSRLSLDWQELPGDYLNLATQQAYTVEEVRNLLNWHLFQRGFTMIRQGEVLTVVNLDKLDPGMVPHVAPEELDKVPEFDFVRVTFRLDRLVAQQAAEELKPLLSPRGKLFPLGVTNRIEAMDLAVNLRQVARVLQEEQASGVQQLVREFVLQYARAEETLGQLKELLGIPESPGTIPPGMNPQQWQQLQQMQQMMAVQGGAPIQVKPPGQPAAPDGKSSQSFWRRPSDVNLVVNPRRNSIIAQAPPDKMAIIEQAVKLLDVPRLDESSVLANLNRFQVYRLAAIDPEPLVKTLREIGGLDPSTRLEVDKQNNAIIAYAPLADHVTIRALIERLDGTGRRFEVIQLRRLPADYVAGTIEFMMGGQDSATESSPPWLPPWERTRRQQEANTRNRFRVDADVENNRLLLWANDVEIQEVQKLLVKLGEISEPGTFVGRVRTFDFADPAQAQSALEFLQRHWKQVSPYPLRVEKAPGLGPASGSRMSSPQEAPSPGKTEPDSQAKNGPKPATVRAVAIPIEGDFQIRPCHAIPLQTVKLERGLLPPLSPEKQGGILLRPSVPTKEIEKISLSQVQQKEVSEPEEPRGAESLTQFEGLPEVIVYQTPDGRLVFTCRDPAALELIEQLLRDVVPPAPTYQIFRLRYAWAESVARILQSLFSDRDETRSQSPFWFPDPWSSSGSSQRGKTGRLSERRPLKFVADIDTNSIVVQNADARQLAEIKQIIDFYDQPPPTDGQSVRVTEIFVLRWAKASQLATAIKDVYRDLLSPNESQQAGQRGFVFFLRDSMSDVGAPRFKGLLSVGVDESSNSLVVSAPLYLMNDIRQLITQLDRNAEPHANTIEVVRLKNGLSAEHLRKGLGSILSGGGTPSSGSQQAKEPTQPKPPTESRPPTPERR